MTRVSLIRAKAQKRLSPINTRRFSARAVPRRTFSAPSPPSLLDRITGSLQHDIHDYVEEAVRTWVQDHWHALRDQWRSKRSDERQLREAAESYCPLLESDPWPFEDSDADPLSRSFSVGSMRREPSSSSFLRSEGRRSSSSFRSSRSRGRGRDRTRSQPIPIVKRPPEREPVHHPPDSCVLAPRLFERDIAAFDLPTSFAPSDPAGDTPTPRSAGSRCREVPTTSLTHPALIRERGVGPGDSVEDLMKP